jgi:integrase
MTPPPSKQAEKQAPIRRRPPSSPSPKNGTRARRPAGPAKHASQVWRSLEIDILPTLGPRPIDEIQPREIMALIENIEDRGAGEIATRVLQRVRAVFSRAVALGHREVNPASELHNHLKPRKKGQQTALAAEELPAFLHALETYRAMPRPGWDCGY